MSHKDEGLKTRHRQYWKKIEADSVVLDPGIIAISWEDSTIRLHDGYTIGGRIFPMAPAPSLTVNVLTPLSGNGSVSSPIALNIAALANQVPVLANAPITGHGVTGDPLGLDLVALAAALANTVPIAHDASLVGNGTVGAPLSVNWGIAPQQPVSHNGTLSGAGTVASPLAVVPAALASLVSVSAISPITGDGKVATPLMLDVAALLPQLHNKVAVATDGITITGSGTTANPLAAVPTIPVVVTSSPITGNGTLANPIDINIVSAIAEIAAAGGVPAAHDASLTGNGTTALPLGVNWANMPALNVQHDGSMTGQGTAGNPLGVNWSAQPAISVQHDGTMTGSGTAGSPLSVNPIALANQVPVTVAAGLSGNGTTASPIAPNPATLGPLLAGYVPVAVSAPLSGTGTGASPLGIANATGSSRGVVQLATAAEGLQPANDVDTTTPAYVAAAIAAIPGEKFLQGLQSYNAATNIMTLLMNDGSTVPVDMTGLLADALPSINSPLSSISVTQAGTAFALETNASVIGIADGGNYFVGTTIEQALAELGAAKHSPASINSPLNSVSITTAGQSFSIDTNAGVIGIADGGNYYAGATIEAALQEIGASILGLNATAHAAMTFTSSDSSIVNSGTGQALNLTADATNISFVDSGNVFATDTVEAALVQLGAVSHPPATLISSLNSINVFPAGTAGQTIFIDTNSTLIGAQDLGGYYTGPTIEDQLQEIGAALTVAGIFPSDKRLKRDIKSIPDDVAIEFSRRLSFYSFARFRDRAIVEARISKNSARFRDRAIVEARISKNSARNQDALIANLKSTITDKNMLNAYVNELTPKKPQHLTDADLLVRAQEVGVIAQEVLALAAELGYGQWLVIENTDGFLSVDYNSLYGIVMRGYQLRLEKAGI